MTSFLSRFASTIICLVLISLSESAHAIDETYELYSDNGDYYLKAEPTWVPISGSIFIIIPVYKGGDILKLTESNGTWSVQNLTFSQFNSASPVEVTDGSVSYSDLNSDGSIDIALNLGSASGNQLLEIINNASTGIYSANVPNNGWNAKGGMVADAALPVMNIPESTYYGPLKGGAGVSGGSATYSIPIELPPGRNNVQPSVSIQYSNRSGNGIAGVGWSMSAESKIHRCSATEAQDGYKAAVQFDATLDRLCLDGQRLISVGIEDYGTNGAVYKTEMESLVIVTQTGGINSATSSFVAQLPDGRSQEFGTTIDSRHSPSGVSYILNWALAKIVDLSGNNIVYTYSDHSTSEYLLDSILYTGLGTALGNRKVLFDYEDKAVLSTSFIAGGKVRTTKQLATITTAIGEDTIRQYALSYDESLNSGRNLLRSVTACGFENEVQVDCFETTTFQWQETAPQYAFEKLGYQDGSTFVTPFSNARYLKDVIPSGDIDGNGVRDYAGFSMDAEGNFIETNTKQLTHCYFAANSFSITCPIADFNNDGKSDSFRQSGGKLQIKYTDSGSWFDTSIIWENNTRHLNMPVAFSDFNGDGRVDVAFKHHQTNVGNSKLYVYLHTGNNSAPYSTAGGNSVLVHDFAVPTYNGGIYRDTRDVQVSGDMDGNGLLDFVLFDNNAYSSLIAPGMPIPDKIFLTKVNSAGAISIDKTSRDFSRHVLSSNYNGNFLHDVNGDGLVDWLSFSTNSSALLYRLNNGTDFELTWKSLGVSIPTKQVEYLASPGEWEYYVAPVMSKVMFFDYDGDGKDDFLFAGDILASSCAYTGIRQVTKWYCDEELYTSYTFDRGGVQNFFGPAIASGRFDNSAREFNFVKITENATGDLVSAAPVATDIIASATQQAALDATGDGLVDIVTVFGCRFASSECEWNEDIQASTYLGATTATDIEPGGYINRNLGAATGGEFYAAYDVMKSVDNGVGLKSAWTYHPLTTGAVDDFYSMNFDDAVDSQHFHFASSMFAVSKFEQDSGVGTTKNTIDYQYNGAMYNTQGRGFRGFRKITETHLLTQLSTETTFGQKFPQSGLVERRETYALNRSTTTPFKIETNDWQDNLAHNVTGVYLLHNEQSETTTYDIAALTTLVSKETRTISQDNLSDLHVDAWGNPLKTVNISTDNVYGENTVTSTNVFAATDSWPNKLTCTSVEKSYVPSMLVVSIDADVDLNKTTTTKIDTWDTTNRKPLSVSLRAGAPASNCDITGLGIGTTTVTNYTSFGLLEQVNVTGEVLNGAGDTAVTQTRTTEMEYTADGYFVDKITLNQSHVQGIVTDSRSGLPLQTTDANGIKVDTTYDSLFRPTSIKAQGVPIQAIRYRTPDSDSPNTDAIAMVSAYQAGQPESHEYKDKLGRTLRTKTQDFDGNDIYADMRYDQLGRMTKQSNPHSGTAVYTLYNNYDELGRVGQKVTPSTDVNEALTTDYAYTGLKTDIDTTASDGHDLSMSRTYNAQGHLMETVDAKTGKTEYAYDAAGNPVVIMDAAGNSIFANYDDLGRKLWVDDPNQSHFVSGVKARRKQFTYNDFNELEKETDTNNESISYDMDAFGRVTHRYSGDGNANFVWDTKKKGLLTSEYTPDVSKDYGYDALARVKKVTTTIDTSVYEVETQYDGNFGRPKSIEYPNQLTVGFKYNDYGYLTHEQNASSLYVYREITASDNYGNTTGSKIGNGRLTGSRVYSASTGQMLNTMVEKNGIAIHYLDYENYDSYGNIIKQRNRVTSIDTTDLFVYDELHRLTKSTTSGSSVSAIIDYEYDAVGNLTSKSDYSTTANNAYLYENGTNRLVSVALKGGAESETFGYDENGNQTSRSVVNVSTNNTTSSGSVTYNAFNKPTYINRLGSQVSLSYDANWARYKQERTVNGVTTLTHYIDKLYEVEVENGSSKTSSYISDVAIIIEKSNTESIRFTHNDRLGSTSTFTDHYGNVTAYRSYDPFGKPKMGDGSLMSSIGLRARLSNNLADTDMATRRGFTSHEHLDEVEIIHMNGRVYDYNVGRFMGVDPFIQSPSNSQSINPYSYVMNNPLGYTDPTGYCGTRINGATSGSCKSYGGVSTASVSVGVEMNKDGSATITFSGSNGADVSAVKNHVTQQLQDGGFGVTDINSNQNISKTTTNSTGSSQISATEEETGFFTNLWRNINPFSTRNLLESEAENQTESGVRSCKVDECVSPELAEQYSALAGTLAAYPPGKIAINPVGMRLARSGSDADNILFGQQGVSRTFTSPDKGSIFEFAGRSIAEVAKGLRNGSISPNQIPVEYVIINGQRIAVNNRSLTALRRAGMQATRTRNVTNNSRTLNQVQNRLLEMGGSPSNTITIRGIQNVESAIY